MNNLISVVNTQELTNGILSELHLQSSKEFINPDTYPTYQNIQQGLLFIERKLVDIDQIVSDDELLGTQGFYTQLARTTVADKKQLTRHSIIENGLMLSRLPISIVQLPNGKFASLDGRTRLDIFEVDCKLKNVIADVYEYDTNYSHIKQQLAGQRFAMIANCDEAPSSPFTMDDIVRHTVNAVQTNGISREDIKNEVELVNKNQFSQLKINKMVLRIKNILEESKEGVPLVNTYDEKSAPQWLKNIAKIQSNQNNNGIYYLTVSSTFHTKFIPWAAKKYQELLLDIALNNKTKCKQLRIVVYVSDLSSSDLELSWKTGIDKFRNQVEKLMNLVCKTWFTNIPEITNKVVMYGAIPSVYSLEQKYPMNKIVRFTQDLKDQTFDEIDLPKTLDDYLDIN
jgi:hypothetical protein|tara:strand:- start:46 stop:1239 length:1194 start_codon:yes stop_codon:yes gene_type:complete